MTLNELLEQSKNTYINYNLKINRNKNRFKETNKSITKNLSDEEVKRIKKNKLKPFLDKSFNLNIEPNETEILSNKNINLYDRYSMYSVFGIGESKYKDLLINAFNILISWSAPIPIASFVALIALGLV